MQTELENGFDKDKVIADLQAKLLAKDEKTSEPLLQPPPLLERAQIQMPTTKIIEGQVVSVGDSVSQKNALLPLPPAPIQPQTDQRTLADKSLNQIKQFFRDRSPEISEPMIVSDSESNDSDGESDIQFTPNKSKQASKEKAKRKSRGVAKGIVKSLMDAALANPKPWNCGICSDSFQTSELCRQHASVKHKGRPMCNRCPYIGRGGGPSHVKIHEQSHARNEVNVKNLGQDCKLCHIKFTTNGHLVAHLRQFHLPKDSQIESQ